MAGEAERVIRRLKRLESELCLSGALGYSSTSLSGTVEKRGDKRWSDRINRTGKRGTGSHLVLEQHELPNDKTYLLRAENWIPGSVTYNAFLTGSCALSYEFAKGTFASILHPHGVSAQGAVFQPLREKRVVQGADGSPRDILGSSWSTVAEIPNRGQYTGIDDDFLLQRVCFALPPKRFCSVESVRRCLLPDVRC